MKKIGRKLVPEYQWGSGVSPWAGKSYRLRDESVLVGRPGLADFLMGATAVANINGGFRPLDILKVKHIMANLGLKRIVGLSKWSHGGAQGARSMGYVYFHKDPDTFLKELFMKYTGHENYTGKLYHRALKFVCCEVKRFTKLPRITDVSILGEDAIDMAEKGITFVSRNFAAKECISPGDKLEPLKSSVMLTSNNSFDIYYSEENNKLKVPVELLAKIMGVVPSLQAKKRNSQVLRVHPDGAVFGRWPAMSLDIQRLFGVRELKGMAHLKELAAGLGTKEDYEKLLRYKDSMGKWTMPSYTAGFKTAHEFLTHKFSRLHIFKTLMNVMFKRIRVRMRGGFCVALPAPEGMVLKETVFGFRSPIILPVKMSVHFAGSVCYLNRKVWEQFFAGDYDGDLFTWFSLSTVVRMNKLFGTNIEFLDFTGTKMLEYYPKWPAKVVHEEDVSEEIIEIDGLTNYSAIGRMYGRIATMLDTAGIMGMSVRSRMLLYMDLKAEEEQPFVDGIKYSSTMEMPSLFSLCKKWKLDPAIALGVNWMRVSLRKGMYELQKLDKIVLNDSEALTEALKYQVRGSKLDPDYEQAIHVTGFLESFSKYKQGFYFNLFKKQFGGIKMYNSVDA